MLNTLNLRGFNILLKYSIVDILIFFLMQNTKLSRYMKCLLNTKKTFKCLTSTNAYRLPLLYYILRELNSQFYDNSNII